MDFLQQIIVWLNMLANALGNIFLAPIAFLPGWLSATLVGIVSGILMLVVFKYTSNQRAIKQTRNAIKASLFSLRLFKENMSVTFKAQGRLFANAFRLLLLAVVPILVMFIPMTLLFFQLVLWYPTPPIAVGEEAVITLTLNNFQESPWPQVTLQPSDAFEVELGPVRVQSKGEICWNIVARKTGYHRLAFEVEGQTIEKDLAIGDGFMKVSPYRPGSSSLMDIVENPKERPFSTNSPIQSIHIAYLDRHSWIDGSDFWIYWFIVAFVAALLLRGTLKVNI